MRLLGFLLPFVIAVPVAIWIAGKGHVWARERRTDVILSLVFIACVAGGFFLATGVSADVPIALRIVVAVIGTTGCTFVWLLFLSLHLRFIDGPFRKPQRAAVQMLHRRRIPFLSLFTPIDTLSGDNR